MHKYTSLYNEHIKLNAQMINFGEWVMPLRYNSEKIEHMNVRNNVGIFDVSHMGEILINGPDAMILCEYLFTNNISKANSGQAIYSGMLNEDGKFIDDVIIYKFSQIKFLICTNALNDQKNFLHIESVIKEKFIKKNINLTSVSDQYSQIAVQGPKSNLVLEKIFFSEINMINYYHFIEKQFLIEDKNMKIIIARTGYTGEDGFEIFIKKEDAVIIWKKLLKNGKEYKIMPCGLSSRDTLRLESGMCLYGNEIDETITPINAKLKWIVKLNEESDFIGKKSLLNQVKYKGTSKTICGLELLENRIARKGYEILDNENNNIGKVTSGTISPFFKKSIAIGYVNSNINKIGMVVKIKIRNKFISSKIIQLPFYKKKK